MGGPWVFDAGELGQIEVPWPPSLKRLLFLKPSFVENWIVLHCAF